MILPRAAASPFPVLRVSISHIAIFQFFIYRKTIVSRFTMRTVYKMGKPFCIVESGRRSSRGKAWRLYHRPLPALGTPYRDFGPGASFGPLLAGLF